MANVIEELLIAVGADISGAIKGIRDVEKAVGGMAAGVAGASGTAGASIAAIGAQGAAALGSMADAAGTVRDGINAAGTQGKASLAGVVSAAAKAGRELGKAGAAGTDAFSAMSKMLDTMGGKLRGIAAPLLAAFGAKKLVGDYVGQADALGMLSKRLKISVEDIDAWSQANVAAGGSADALRQSLKAYYDATGRPAEEFFKLGEKIEGMTDRQKMAYLRAQGVAWDAIPVFLKGQKEADRLVAKYRKTAFTAEDGERARKFRVAWQDFGRAAQAVGNVLARIVLPPMTALLDLIAKTINALRESPVLLAAVGAGLAALFPARLTAMAGRFVFTVTRLHGTLQALAAILGKKLLSAVVSAVGSLAGFVTGTGGAMKAAGGFLGLIKGIGAAVIFLCKNPLAVLRMALGAAGMALKAFGVSAWAATGPLGLLVAACVGLFLALEDIYTFFTGGDSVFGRVLSGILSKEEIDSLRNAFKQLKIAIGAIFDAVKPAIIKVLFVLMKGFLMLVSLVLTVVADIVALFVKLCSLVGKAGDMIADAWHGLTGWLDDAAKCAGEFWDSLCEGAAALPATIYDAVAGLFDSIGTTVLDSLADGFRGALDVASAIFDRIGSMIAEKVKAPFKDAFSGVKSFFGFGDDATPGARSGDREKETVLQRFGVTRSNTVNTNASVNVVNNIQTQDNPAAIGQAVGRTLQPAGMRMGNLIGMSTSGVFLKGG